MRILALERGLPGVDAETCAPFLAAEARRVWELVQEGTIREIYFRCDRKDAVLLLECAHARDAQEALSSLPLVRVGLIDFELIPLRAYDGFSRLFADG